MRQTELINIAAEKNVSVTTIDKDWVLGHFLNALYAQKEVQENFVFKGGTCLRKCYFEDYRFSEDLDFTLLDKELKVDSNFLQSIIEHAEIMSGAKFHIDKIKHQQSANEDQGYEIKIKYWGANHKPNQKPLPKSRWLTSIKLDISFSEKIFSTPVEKKIIHNYSDYQKISSAVVSYDLKELIAEKLRSLIQRNRPRDIYDIWYLQSIIDPAEYSEIHHLLREKAKIKSIDIINANDFVNPDKQKANSRAWQSSLGNHLPIEQLPDFESAYAKMKPFVTQILNS
jgi:predicted nucleotidyltransferase component of viral defense system